MKKLIGFFVVVAWLLGCSQEPSPQTNTDTGPKIKSIHENGKLQMLFLYNTLDQVVEIQKYFDDGQNVWESWRYSYQSDRVVKQEYWSSHPLYLSSWPKAGKPLLLQSTTAYEYTSNQSYPTKILSYSSTKPNEVSSYQLNSHDASGKLVKSETFTGDGKKLGEMFYQYDQRGNLLQWGSSYWEYDTQPSPLSKLKVPYWNISWPSPNNATSNFGLDANGNKANEWRYEYTYDPVSGFPLTYKIFVQNTFRAEGRYEYN